MKHPNDWFECDCSKGFFRQEAGEAIVTDDGDQMYGRAMNGSTPIMVCPYCGGEDTFELMEEAS